jgi:hypothetical protein
MITCFDRGMEWEREIRGIISSSSHIKCRRLFVILCPSSDDMVDARTFERALTTERLDQAVHCELTPGSPGRREDRISLQAALM